MATNSLQGVFMTRLARLTLDALLTSELPITSFFTDFSAEAATYGNGVTTRYPNTPIAVTDYTNAKAHENANTTPRTIILDQYVGTGFEFTDTEVSFSDLQLTDIFVKPALNAIFENVMANALARVTAGNFPSAIALTAAQFNANNVAAVSGVQTIAKVARSPRHLLIPPTYAQTLKTDPSVQAAYAYGPGNTIRSGVIPEVHGYQVHEWNGAIPNTANLAAIAFHPQAMLIAARPPALPRNWAGEVRNVTMPNTGLTVQIRDYYNDIKQVTEWCIIYGTQIGVPGNLTRITS